MANQFGISPAVSNMYYNPKGVKAAPLSNIGGSPYMSSLVNSMSPSGPKVSYPSSGGSIKGVTDKSTTGGGGSSSGGGGGGGGFAVPQAGQDVNAPEFAAYRASLQNRGQEEQNAVASLYDAMRQKALNQIPGLEQQRDLRIQGLDDGLNSFRTTADLEQGKRMRGIDDAVNTTNEQYTRAERSTRKAGESLQKSLRNKFAALGSLDSTQYRDESLERTSEFLQGVGDVRREKAGKLTTFEQERGDVRDYYSNQILSETKRVEVEKNKARAETSSLIQGVMDDANITDKQKVEKIVAAKGRLETALMQLDQQEIAFKQQAQKDAQDYAIKMASLQSKGYSDSFTSAKGRSAALDKATAILEQYRNDDGSIALSPEGIAAVGRSVGYPEEELDGFVANFGVPLRKGIGEGSLEELLAS